MWMERVGVIWTASGSGIADQTQRHDLWDVVDNVFLVVDHITHSLWNMKTTGRLKEINGKSKKLVSERNQRGKSEMCAKKMSKNELFTHLKWSPMLGTSCIRMVELYYELFCLTKGSKKTINFPQKELWLTMIESNSGLLGDFLVLSCLLTVSI